MREKYGLIGYPLGHSFSRQYHNERFERENIAAVYDIYELPNISLLPELVTRETALRGLNVTIPYKQSVMTYLDAIDNVAQRVGAVNVIKIERDNNRVRMVGYNSDYMGFRNSLTPLLQPHHRHALVLGTGGASKAVCAALHDLNIATTSVSRTPGEGKISYEELSPEVMEAHTLIVNATPLGMYPRVADCAPIPYTHITPRHLCYDVVYNPQQTAFMQRCALQGATVCNGLQMLYGQADAAWEIWKR